MGLLAFMMNYELLTFWAFHPRRMENLVIVKLIAP
jgi:hypothetical protein